MIVICFVLLSTYSECGVTANILVLGTKDSGFESLHSDHKNMKSCMGLLCFQISKHMLLYSHCGIGLVVEYLPSKQGTRVRFSYPAQIRSILRELKKFSYISKNSSLRRWKTCTEAVSFDSLVPYNFLEL